MYLTHNLQELIMNKSNKKLIFIHIPKCAGSYVASILSYLKIQNKGHTLALPNEGITFTVIRNPVERFESLLNYRLNEKEPRIDWPIQLNYVYKDKSISLNEIVSKMTDKQILGFDPYKTLTYWIKNIDIIITIDELPKLLEHFGYKYDLNLFPRANISNKKRDKFNIESYNKIKRLYNDDMILYNNVINSKF